MDEDQPPTNRSRSTEIPRQRREEFRAYLQRLEAEQRERELRAAYGPMYERWCRQDG